MAMEYRVNVTREVWRPAFWPDQTERFTLRDQLGASNVTPSGSSSGLEQPQKLLACLLAIWSKFSQLFNGNDPHSDS